ncbi:hypothetical protein C0Q70_11919 [Pomacea canaliculata]|uniref:Uncharacterized protein n=1 Tax=Pomacea canaliculata TaxID=400727 RepID=A0A2T7P7C2_POMCA|nr:hypothetical protein C0Q70_11919 [Pomacea canaliculata]
MNTSLSPGQGRLTARRDIKGWEQGGGCAPPVTSPDATTVPIDLRPSIQVSKLAPSETCYVRIPKHLEAPAQPHLYVRNIYTSTSDDRCTTPRHTRDRRHTGPGIVNLQRPAVTATVDRWDQRSATPIVKMVLLESFSLQVLQVIRLKVPGPVAGSLRVSKVMCRPHDLCNRNSARAAAAGQETHPSKNKFCGVRSRPLGAGIYPVLNSTDIEREKALFRATVDALSSFVSSSGNSSNISPAAGKRCDNPSSASGNKLCRAARAQFRMNNAGVARVYNSVPQRVSNGHQSLGYTRTLVAKSVCSRREAYDSRRSSCSTDLERNEGSSGTSLAGQQRFEKRKEESRMKQESFAILSAHLKIEDLDEESKLCIAERQVQRRDSPTLGELQQHPVLGPSVCSDCSQIRRSAQVQQEQAALYPGVTVNPRTLVAPDRLRRLNATLPPNLFNEKHRLHCGCAINLHRDFLFPVIFTDHDIQSRLRSLKTAPPQRPSVCDWTSPPSDVTGLKDQDSELEEEEDEGVDKEDNLSNASDTSKSMNPEDMKVTVSYNTPSPDQGPASRDTNND